MPVESCTLPEGGKGYRWGKEGKCYSERSDAERQGRAIEANKEDSYKGVKAKHNYKREKL